MCMNPSAWRYIAIAAISALTGGATITGVGMLPSGSNDAYMTRKDVQEAIDEHPAIVGIQFELRRIARSLDYIEGEMRNRGRNP